MNNLIVVLIFIATALGLFVLGLGSLAYVSGRPPASAGRRLPRPTPATSIGDSKEHPWPV